MDKIIEEIQKSIASTHEIKMQAEELERGFYEQLAKAEALKNSMEEN